MLFYVAMERSPTSAAPPESAPESMPGAAAGEIETLRAEVERWRDETLRARAETENARKRARAEASGLAEAAAARVAAGLLPVLDGFDRALPAPSDAGANGAADDPHLEGVRLLVRMLAAALEGEGLEAFAPRPGDRFDPLRHEAVERREDAAAPDGSVAETLARGYLFRGRLLRPARVAVAVAPAETSDEESTDA